MERLGVPEDFYVERASCAWCRQPTVRFGLRSVDATREHGKEPVVCGSCLASARETIQESVKKSIAHDQELDQQFRGMMGGG
jgi:bacterioferritin-associated ferredoxin